MKFKTISIILVCVFLQLMPHPIMAIDHPGIVSEVPGEGKIPLILLANGISLPGALILDPTDNEGVWIAATNVSQDFKRVCGAPASLVTVNDTFPTKAFPIIAGTFGTPLISRLIKNGKLSASDLEGKREKYILTTVKNPFPGINEALVIAGSDKRGTIYGLYELSEQIGVSPWYDWADVPPVKHKQLYINKGTYTAGEPAVKYRGIFLNDEGPCLMSWVKNTYGTDYGDHRFYARVYELILRLRGNFLWPAMWAWAFYADDPENSVLADKTGVIIGTSHHEPMARNHQEWARKRKDFGAWNYTSNRATLDKFFSEGIKRMKNTEDVVTIGMRGDGDEAMSADADVKLLKQIIKNQRSIIRKETGRDPKQTPQVWALYKEVLDYYDAGLRVPDDVTLLLCDDNWGNIRRLPNEQERKHPGGWGMYYHVDYVGAPRNSKTLNCTPIQNMWEQMRLTYDYGVDRMWILNVGDLKPMEYPITLFLDMAWNPKAFDNETLPLHTLNFFEQQLGKEQAEEAARIFNLLCKYNGRVTPELLDCDTYNLNTGEWEKVAGDFSRLEAEALRQFISLPDEYKDTYRELILFPVQLMSNLYEMYFSQAMNRHTSEANLPEANFWAEKVEKCFERDSILMHDYNNNIAGGKWNGMMIQKHIGYTGWNDDFPADKMPVISRVSDTEELSGGFLHTGKDGTVVIEAPHFYNASSPSENMKWTLLKDIGRTLGGIAVTPYTSSPEGAIVEYKITIPEKKDSVDVHVVVKSSLAFSRKEGHRYVVGFKGAVEKEINFNGDLNEHPDNIYSVFYPTVARRVVEKIVRLPLPTPDSDGTICLYLKPLDPGVVFEKIVIDCGGYQPEYLFGKESKCTRKFK